jgi:molybdopterin converting factor small subunit
MENEINKFVNEGWKIKVRLFAILREIAGSDYIIIDDKNNEVEIINEIIKKVPKLKDYLIKNGKINEKYKIIINKNEAYLLPPFTGG